MDFVESDARPSKRRRYECLGPVDITWPGGVEPSYSDELKLRSSLIAGRHETGKGSELPLERQVEIESEANRLGLSIPQVLHMRFLYMKQLVRGGQCLGDDCDTEENRDMFREATAQLLRWQWQVRIITKVDMEESECNEDIPDIVIPDGGCIINGMCVHWIECITSYGSASLAKDPHIFLSSLYDRAERNYSRYGSGAFVFLFGFSRDLMQTLHLDPAQVMFLGSDPINIREIIDRCFPSEEGLIREEVDCASERVGLVIGAGGHMIRELIARSGCEIVVHRDSAAGPSVSKIVITSSHMDNINMAKSLIEEVVSGQNLFCRHVLCPLDKVGKVIGKQGTTVTEIMRLSNCSIKTHKDNTSSDGKHQVFVLSGMSENCVLEAERLINSVVRHGRAVLEKKKKEAVDSGDA